MEKSKITVCNHVHALKGPCILASGHPHEHENVAGQTWVGAHMTYKDWSKNASAARSQTGN